MKKIIIISVLILGAIGAFLTYNYVNKGITSTFELDTDISITANKLLSKFENNEKEANTQFLDKVIEVSGTVSKIEKGKDKTSIYLETENPLSSVICELEGDVSVGVSKGEMVIVKGKCTGYLLDVIMVNCITVDK